MPAIEPPEDRQISKRLEPFPASAPLISHPSLTAGRDPSSAGRYGL
jgi:hypothetical protein